MLCQCHKENLSMRFVRSMSVILTVKLTFWHFNIEYEHSLWGAFCKHKFSEDANHFRTWNNRKNWLLRLVSQILFSYESRQIDVSA